MPIKATTYTALEMISIYDGLTADKGTLENHLQEVVDLCMPNSSDVTTTTVTAGVKKGQAIFDGTAPKSLRKLTKAIHSALTSSAAQWFGIQLKDEEFMKVKAISDWFAVNSRTMFDFMVESNFHNEIQKSYGQLIGPATCAFATDEIINPRTMEFEKLKYETWAVREFVFSEGADDLPTMIIRKHNITADKAMDKWGKHPRFKGLGVTAQASFDNVRRRYTDKQEYLEVFYKRTQYIKAKGQAKVAMHMEWGYSIVDYKDKKKIIEGGKMEQSVCIGRWEKNADDHGWGRSPSMEAMPTIKTLNDIVENGLKSLKKDLSPPLVISHKGVIGNVRTHQAAIIWKRRNATLETLDSGSRYDAAQMYQEGLKQDVKEHYMVDQIELTQNDSKTLGEYYSRYQTMMRLLGPTYGRLTYEIFNPTLYRTFQILLRNGKFTPMPEELIELAGDPDSNVQLDVKYTGSLARSQRTEEVDAITMAYQDGAGIAQVTQTQDVLDWIDGDRAMQLAMELRGVPSEVIRTQDQVQEIRTARAEAMAKAQAEAARIDEAETVGAEADAAGKVVDIQQRQTG